MKKQTKTVKQFRWKFLREGMKSENGNCVWEIGKWKHQNGDIWLCSNGFHCSKGIGQALSYVRGEILAKVEVKGEVATDETKDAWSDMRIIKAYKWQKEDSVSLAIYAAELVLDIYEKKYPNDDRPRKAIEAAKRWLTNPSAYAADAAAHTAAYAAAHTAAYAAAHTADAAAYAAYAAYAADAAAHTAAYAAYAADAAAYAAYAAHTADAAAYAAAYAAAHAARQELIGKIEAWLQKRVSQLEEIEK